MTGSGASQLPDLSSLLEGIEWTEDEDGVRHGELDLGDGTRGRAMLYQFELRVGRP